MDIRLKVSDPVSSAHFCAIANRFSIPNYKLTLALDVYHPAHEPTSFAFVTREAASTPCSCYVFKNDSVELVEQIVKKLKLEIGSGKRKRLGETSGLTSYHITNKL